MIPTKWKKKRISEVFDRVVEPVTVETSSLYQEIGIRSHAKGIFHKKPVTGKSLGSKRVFHIKPNCFVVNIVFAWEQAIAKTTINEKGMIASHRFPMYEPKDELCDIDYILYLFKTKYGKHLLGLASPGGAGRNKTLGQNEFSKLELILPPLPEQKRIAEILSTWDKTIETTERLLANSQKQKKALMQQLLTGKKRLPGFNGEWEEVKFDEVLNIEIGGTPSRSNPDYWDERKETENRWLSIADLKGQRIFDTTEYISDLGVSKSNVTLIPKETIVMSFKLSIGKRAFLESDCYTNEAICALVIKDRSKLYNSYLYQALDVVDYEKEIDQAVKGKTLNKAKLKRLKLKLPSVDEQISIANILSKADQETEFINKKLECLINEKKALMQQLLTGKKRIKA